MKDKIIIEIEKNNLFCKNDRVAVAFSGGIDSVVLLHCLKDLSDKIGFKLFAFHVNHNIREESGDDEVFCSNFAKILNVDFFAKSLDVLSFVKKEKVSIEEGARILRYKALNELADINKVNKICLAHHKDDQIETILMHIERGSGVSGLVGMKMISNNLIRPLLNISRCDIEQYAKENNLNFVFDKSNNDIKYKRNYVRKVILPAIRKQSVNFENLLIKLSDCALKFENEIDKLLPKNLVTFNKNVARVDNDVKKFNNTIVASTIRYALKEINSIVDIEEKHINILIDLFNKQVGKKINLPNGLCAIREHKCIEIFKSESNAIDEKAFGLGELDFAGKKFFISYDKPSCDYLRFDFDKIPAKAMWRRYKQGDVITKFDGKTKSVKEFCTDKKISAKVRDSLPMLCYGGICYCIAGVEINAIIKVDAKTKNVCYLYEIKD